MESRKIDKAVDIIIIICLVFFSLAVIYPFYYVVINSFNADIGKGPAILWPSKFYLKAYKLIFTTPKLFNAFLVSVSRTLVGTAVTVFVCSLCAYTLRKRNLAFRNFYLVLFTIPMFFSGGLIPGYLNLRTLKIIDTFWVYIIPQAFSFFSVIILMTAFNDLSDSLEESARIDGASYTQCLVKIYFPLCIPVIATIALFQGVDQWNKWFDTMYFTNNPRLMTLAGILIQIINKNQVGQDMAKAGVGTDEVFNDTEAIKMATIVVAVVPIVLTYPYLQRYFIKGLTIGSVKG